MSGIRVSDEKGTIYTLVPLDHPNDHYVRCSDGAVFHCYEEDDYFPATRDFVEAGMKEEKIQGFGNAFTRIKFTGDGYFEEYGPEPETLYNYVLYRHEDDDEPLYGATPEEARDKLLNELLEETG